jgi:hypothetical protein
VGAGFPSTGSRFDFRSPPRLSLGAVSEVESASLSGVEGRVPSRAEGQTRPYDEFFLRVAAQPLENRPSLPAYGETSFDKGVGIFDIL